jgi:hypothetical protein
MPSGELVGTTLKITTGQEVTDGHSHFPTANDTSDDYHDQVLRDAGYL